ncbi:MAG TPA: tetratricopeptide repeat protein [Oculatellaceae cyanobacterium]
MTSSTSTATVPTNRRPSLKLVVVLIAALVLVTIPVIPMRLYGVGLLPLKQLSQLWPGADQPKPSETSAPVATDAQASRSDQSLKTDEELSSLDGAAQKLVISISQNPADPSLHNQLGLIYEGLGDSEKAIPQFQSAVDLCRAELLNLASQQRTLKQQVANDKLSLSMIQSARLSTELSAAHSALARIYDQLGMRDKVVAELDMLNRDRAFGSGQKTQERATVAQGQIAVVHRLSPACLQLLARAQALTQSGRNNEAVQLYKQVLSMDPQAAIAHQQLGQTALANGNSYLAKEELSKAAELDPSNAATHVSLAMAYRQLSQFEPARNELQKAVQVDPKNYGALFQLGSLYASGGKNALAAQTFQRAVDLNPRSAAAHNNLGSSLSMAGKYRDAIGEFEKALALSPTLASSHYGMGVALYNMRQYPAAVSELKRAVSLNPNYADAKTKIQLCYRHTNSVAGGAGIN